VQCNNHYSSGLPGKKRVQEIALLTDRQAAQRIIYIINNEFWSPILVSCR
jgi:hypothetical protein